MSSLDSGNHSRYPAPFQGIPHRSFPRPEDAGYVFAPAAPRHRYWLHVLLFVLTLLTTTVVGAGLALSFDESRPTDLAGDLYGYATAWRDPGYLLTGLPFSLTLLGILLAHEMGHFLTARYYRVDATLPFFLPAPTLIGTFGAFIRIRSVIVSKRVLFDIGIGGPIAGFAVLVLPLVAGVSMSKVVPGIANAGDVVFGTPILLQWMQALQFPGVPSGDIYLHPMARAAWVGLLATALNLFPIGQLDGGHILYSFLGNKMKYVSRILVAVLLVLGWVFDTWSWWAWAFLLLLFGMRHPHIVDPNPVGRTRTWLALGALAIFVVSFTPSPIR